MAFRLRPRATTDLTDIIDYLSARSPVAGERFVEATSREFQFLSENPRAGQLRQAVAERLKGLRSWPVKGFRNYLIFYMPDSEGVEIYRILHGARNVDRIVERS